MLRRRIAMTGDAPSPIDKPPGCAFHTRCRYAQDICAVRRPPLAEVSPGTLAACHFPLRGALS